MHDLNKVEPEDKRPQGMMIWSLLKIIIVLLALLVIVVAVGIFYLVKNTQKPEGQPQSISKESTPADSKSDQSSARTDPKTVSTEQVKPIIFNPKGVQARQRHTPLGEADSAYEAAANTFAPYAQAAAYERMAILRRGVPLLARMMQLNDLRLQQDSEAPDLLRLAKLDPRFAECGVRNEVRRVLDWGDRSEKLHERFSVVDPGGIATSVAPSVENQPIVKGPSSALILA
jgi:hypothetical protein